MKDIRNTFSCQMAEIYFLLVQIGGKKQEYLSLKMKKIHTKNTTKIIRLHHIYCTINKNELL